MGKSGAVPVERLNLRLFVHRQYERAIRRVHIETDNIPDLLEKQRILRKLERLDSVGLKCKGAPDPADRALREARAFRHRARAPVRRIRWRRFQGKGQNPLDIGVHDGPRRPRTGFVQEPINTLGDKAGPPFADLGLVRAQFFCDGAVGFPVAQN